MNKLVTAPEVSIIIPHYNSTMLLEVLIDSIVTNLHSISYEILIIDDYSEESKQYEKVEAKCVSDRIKFFKNNRKKGAGTCRNIGISKAKGKWILFADSDDYFLPSLESIIKPKIGFGEDIIFFRPTSFNSDINQVSDRHLIYSNLCKDFVNVASGKNEIRLKLLFLVPWSKMYRRDFLIENSIEFEEVVVSNDIVFSAKAGLKAGKIKCYDESIYCVTKSKNTLTTNVTKERNIMRLAEFTKYYKLLSSNLTNKQLSYLQLSASQYITTSLKANLGLHSLVTIILEILKNRLPLRLY